MSEKALSLFERNFDDWRIRHPRYWIATVDREVAANFISEQAEKIVNAHLQAADRVLVSQDRITQETKRISSGIDELTRGFENISYTFEWGFSEMIWHLEENSALLEEILAVLQAPLNTRAKELRKRASDAYRNGWIDEAMEDFLESEKLNRYDFTIHQSVGNIYLFHKKNSEKALEYYKKAVKYATPRSALHTSIALLHEGLVHYILEDYLAAYDATSRAIDLSPDLVEVYYQHAQYCARLGKYNEAIQNLDKAIGKDRYYFLKASLDDNFHAMESQLRSLFDEYHVAANEKAKDNIADAQEKIQDVEVKIKSFSGNLSSAYERIEVAKNKAREAQALVDSDSLFDEWDAIIKAFVAYDFALIAYSIASDASIKHLDTVIEDLKKECDSKVDGRGKLVAGSIVLMLILMPILNLIFRHENFLGIIMLGLTIGIFVIPFIVFWLVTPFVKLIECSYEKKIDSLFPEKDEIQRHQDVVNSELIELDIEYVWIDPEQHEESLNIEDFWLK